MADFTITEAKARLCELINRVASGDSVRVTRYGKPVARLVGIVVERRPVKLAELRAVTDLMPLQSSAATDLVLRMRDDSRY